MIPYIAGPMTGLPDYNYAAFSLAQQLLHDAGFEEVLNPVDACKGCTHPSEEKPHEWEWYMRSAIGMVLQADGIALLPGWEKSKGATLEVQIGGAIGLPVKPLYDWLTGDASVRMEP